MRKFPLTDDDIRKADGILTSLSWQQWAVPVELRRMQRVSVLQTAYKLGLRPVKQRDGTYEVHINYMGHICSGYIDPHTNSWQIEPEGDPMTTALCCRSMSGLELASVILHQDFLHLEDAARFIWKNFPQCQA